MEVGRTDLLSLVAYAWPPLAACSIYKMTERRRSTKQQEVLFSHTRVLTEKFS